jgi:hypothetical protein
MRAKERTIMDRSANQEDAVKRERARLSRVSPEILSPFNSREEELAHYAKGGVHPGGVTLPRNRPLGDRYKHLTPGQAAFAHGIVIPTRRADGTPL